MENQPQLCHGTPCKSIFPFSNYSSNQLPEVYGRHDATDTDSIASGDKIAVGITPGSTALIINNNSSNIQLY
ncbi:MAG: hypothetical protein WA364_03090 [Candidatus Nitrosopolaris sp.]